MYGGDLAKQGGHEASSAETHNACQFPECCRPELTTTKLESAQNEKDRNGHSALQWEAPPSSGAKA